jgi:hypothetical protein
VGLCAVLAQTPPAAPAKHFPASETEIPVSSDFQAPSEQELEMLKSDLRSQRKQIIAANLHLTDTEAQKFWPIYDQYAAELAKTDDTKFALVNEYRQNYSTLTEEQATKYIKGRADVDTSVIQLRLKYFPIFQKAIPIKKTALFFQMDRRLWLMLDLQIALQNPLIAP